LNYFGFAEKFGWTPDQVDELPASVVEDFLLIMRYQHQLAPKEPVPLEMPHGR
jgi:hypothetical protein